MQVCGCSTCYSFLPVKVLLYCVTGRAVDVMIILQLQGNVLVYVYDKICLEVHPYKIAAFWLSFVAIILCSRLKSQCQLKSDMIIKIADTVKKSISLILSILIDPCTKVTKSGLVCSNMHFCESS